MLSRLFDVFGVYLVWSKDLFSPSPTHVLDFELNFTEFYLSVCYVI